MPFTEIAVRENIILFRIRGAQSEILALLTDLKFEKKRRLVVALFINISFLIINSHLIGILSTKNRVIHLLPRLKLF